MENGCRVLQGVHLHPACCNIVSLISTSNKNKWNRMCMYEPTLQACLLVHPWAWNIIFAMVDSPELHNSNGQSEISTCSLLKYSWLDINIKYVRVGRGDAHDTHVHKQSLPTWWPLYSCTGDNIVVMVSNSIPYDYEGESLSHYE